MPYVYSTLANDNLYHGFSVTKGNLPIITRSVLIKGGAGVATKQLFTPLGVATGVTEEELEFLLKDEVFQTHLNNGFVKYDKKEIEIEKVVSDMTTRDKSAPVVPEDSSESDLARPERAAKVKNNLK